MKNKIVSFVMVMSLLITIVPSSVSALSSVGFNDSNKVVNNNEVRDNKNLLKIKKPTAKEIKRVGSEEEYYRQIITEQLDELYYETKEYSYISSVQSIMDSTYKDAIKLVNETYESVVSSDSALMNIDKAYYKLVVLSGWNTNIVAKDSYYSTLKKAGINAVNDAFACIDPVDFNGYYNSVISGYHNMYLNYLNSSNDLNSLANAFSNIYISIVYDNLDIVDISFRVFYDVYDSNNVFEQIYGYCDYNSNFIDDDYEYIDFLYSVNMSSSPNIYTGSAVYTSDEIIASRNGLDYYIHTYVYGQLGNSDYGVTDEIEKLVDKTEREIEKTYDPDVMYSKYARLISNLESITNIRFQEMSTTKFNKLNSELNKLSLKYTDSNIYSSNNAYKNFEIIEKAKTAVGNVVYEAEIPRKFLTSVENLLKKTPTKKVELANAKKLYANKLKIFINNKKYNQKLVVPIVDVGITEINKATSVSRVKSIYNLYYKRALTTINKYNINTSKTGKGTITKSKTVKYGSSVTITMKPSKGYKISKVYVDNKKVKTTSKYTFKNVNKSHSIKVVFVKEQKKA